MASMCVWPTGTNNVSGLNSLFRKFSISCLGDREQRNILSRRLSTSLSLSPESLHQIRSWLATCCEEHIKCRDSWTLVSANRTLPTRLLEIIQSGGKWRLRLVNGFEASKDSQYITLSHCWGSVALVRLTSENYHVYTDNIPCEILSQTYQNVVEMTFTLGFRYLWIDSLCIIQDSHDDWVRDSAMMGRVYAQGQLNVAATYSRNSEGGLFNQSNSLPASPCIIPMIDNEDALSDAICYEDNVWQREVEAAPLGTRAWVVQERVLAPRILHFSSKQIFWECCQTRAAELLPADAAGGDGELKKVAPYPGTSEDGDPNLTWVHRNWASLVEKYSFCSLTIESDKLVAISGLARRTCGQLGLEPEDYLAGLWRSNMIYGLLFRVERNSSILPKRFPNRAPSWSWASINGKIAFFEQDQASLSQSPYASVLDAHTYHDGDPFGQLKGGFIRLQGPLAAVAPNASALEWLPTVAKEGSTSFTASKSTVFLDESPSHRGPVYFLLLMVDSKIDEPAEVHGLLLCPTGCKRGQFERIGILLYGQAGDFEMSSRNAKDPAKLDEGLYLEADSENGFTIEVI